MYKSLKQLHRMESGDVSKKQKVNDKSFKPFSSMKEPHEVASFDEVKQVFLSKSQLEVWLGSRMFKEVVTGCFVRVSLKMSTGFCFMVAEVVGVKTGMRNYKLGKTVTDVMLMVKLSNQTRPWQMDQLSNKSFTPEEFGKAKVRVLSKDIHNKVRKLARAMEKESELFEREEVRRLQEEAAKTEKLREDKRRDEEQEEQRRQQKEREREEVKRWKREKEVEEGGGGGDQWWVKYQNKNGKEREIQKLKSRLKRFEKIAESSEQPGERENASRLAEQARTKLQQLELQD